MNLLRKALLPLAGAALIVFVLSIGGPRAVHAVVATLVQVENTPTTAVPTVTAPAASQLYSSTCHANYAGSVGMSCSFTPVPAGQTLFIETESINSASDHGADPYNVAIEPSGTNDGSIFPPLVQQPSSFGLDYFAATLAARIWAKAGVTPTCYANLSSTSTAGGLTCTISGYLAPAQ